MVGRLLSRVRSKSAPPEPLQVSNPAAPSKKGAYENYQAVPEKWQWRFKDSIQ